MIRLTLSLLAAIVLTQPAQGASPFLPKNASQARAPLPPGLAASMPSAAPEGIKEWRFGATRKADGVWLALVGEKWVRAGMVLAGKRIVRIDALSLTLANNKVIRLGDSLPAGKEQ